MASKLSEMTLSLDYAYEIDSAFDSDSTDEMDCSDPLAMSGRCNVHESIKVEKWTHPHNSMKQVVNLIVALNRMNGLKPQSPEFGDDELLGRFMKNVIEERNVNWNPETERFTSDSYNKSSRILQCNVCDTSQKSLVRSGVQYHLQAVTLKAANTEQKVLFSLSTYVSLKSSVPNSQPVCLAISGSNLYLACTKENPNDKPTLVLKVVTDTLNTIPADDPNGILFFRSETGVSVNTFESVKYRGWFISTSTVDHERVNMCQESAVDRIKSFQLNDQTLVHSKVSDLIE
ncbi:interleukin-1 beta-like [Xyrauchen texanus]|uniref:interleukin-1 beta-like n=1 Tax=Xyrauchen texanus TaxID=154827 RepID=UPI0022418F63|nr:interleukin-1 beta-like [Xyrauchen texanus]